MPCGPHPCWKVIIEEEAGKNPMVTVDGTDGTEKKAATSKTVRTVVRDGITITTTTIEFPKIKGTGRENVKP